MDKKLRSRMIKYSLTGTAILSAGVSVNGQIVYTDVDPNEVFTDDETSYNLDLNNDGQVDFIIERKDFSDTVQAIRIRVNPEADNALVGSFSGSNDTYFLPSKLDEGVVVDSLGVWNGTANDGTLTLAWGDRIGDDYGNWIEGATDKFLGLRIAVDTNANYHYGWLRLDAEPFGAGFTVKDYAIDTIVNEGINAGDRGGAVVVASTVRSLMAEDIANNGNGSDLQVSFTQAIDESKVAEYRLMIVKASDTTFNLAVAEAVPENRYIQIIPNGEDVSMILEETVTDIDGDLIVEDTAYKVFILSMADGYNATENGLSNGSPVTLVPNTGINELEQGLQIYTFGTTLRINILDPNYKDLKFEVINTLGQKVYFGKLSDESNEFNLNVNSGVYIIHVMDDHISTTKRVYIQ